MAALRGTVTGNRGTASRLGTAKSGLSTRASTWSGEVEVNLLANGEVTIAVRSLDGSYPTRTLHGNVDTGEVGGLRAHPPVKARPA